MPKSVPSALRDYIAKSHIALATTAADGDMPLLSVSDGFKALTGYEREEVIGRNCRLLQSVSRDHPVNIAARAEIAAFFAADPGARPDLQVVLINHRKDGAAFVNMLYMTRLSDINRATRFIFASQFDVTAVHADAIAAYHGELARDLDRSDALLRGTGLSLHGHVLTIARSNNMIAQAKVLLADVEGLALVR